VARYAAATNTLAAEIDDIDVVALGQAIIAYQAVGSAFKPFIPSRRGPRKGILARHDSITWADQDLDTSVSTEPDEQAFTPTSRTYTCKGRIADAVIGQYALADARTTGKTVQQMIQEEGADGYINKFDAMAAAVWDEAPTSGPDHTIGSANDALTASLINQGLRLLFAAKAAPPYALVVHVTKYEELMAIPGMQEKQILGGRNGGVQLGQGAPTSPIVVRGWNGVLDVAISSDIVSSTGYHNMLWSYNPRTPGIINQWTPIETPSGLTPGKMLVDVHWESARRAIEINMTTDEIVQGYIGSSSANNWIVDITTA